MTTMYVHSRCCNAHWELKVVDGIAEFVCEACGKTSGLPTFTLHTPDHCELCGVHLK